MKRRAKQSSRTDSRKDQGSVPSEAPYRSQADRRAEGKALRDAVPRADHSGWRPPKERPDPVELVLAQNEGRVLDLVPIRHGRMAQSPFAFYRGTAAIMAADLAHTPNTGLRVQACGDAHLSNFGAFATPERSLVFDINDLDETLPAPWEWDVKRLTASVVLAGRHIELDGMDDEVLRRYAGLCGWALARAYARSGDAAMIAGYMGSGSIFDEAIGDFASDYADQAERDYKAFVKAVREKRVKAVVES